MSQDHYYNLSHSQEGIWLLEQFSPGTSIATIATTIKIKGIVDFDCLEEAINKVIATQDALRIQLTRIEDRPKQYIIKPQFIRIDHLQFKTKKELFEWDERMTQIPFNLLNQPLFYFATFRLGKHKSGFYQKYHHLICDGYSISLLTDRILDTYLKLKKHETITLEHHSYLDFLEHEDHYINSVKYQKDKEFWHSKLSDISDVAVLKPRSVKDNQFAAARKSFVLDETFAKRFRDYCETQKQSPYSVLLTAIAIYLYKVTGKTNNIIGTPILNRTNRTDKNTIGQFVSTVPLQMTLNPHFTFEEQANLISFELRKVLRHQKYPYHELQEEVFKTKGLSERLFDLGFSYQNFTSEQPHDDLDFELRWRFNRCQIESLFIQASDKNSGGKLIIGYDYVTSLFDEEEISLIHHHLLSILRAAFKHSLCGIDKLEIISQTEKHKILKEFNNTSVPGSTVKLAHELFEEQAARYPDSIALTFENKQLSYRQLNERSNQLCALLVQKGVKRGSFVGLLVTRSFDMAIGIMAILKAGGAYVPIDAEYPEDRIKYMLDDCGASVVLTNKRLSKQFGTKITSIRIDQLSNHLNDTSNPNLNVRPEDLAYIIYTSGSSGQPKAVMIRHSSLGNFIEGIAKRIDFAEESVMLGLTTISFDIFGLEFFVPLSLGLRVVLANEVQEKEPRELARLINNQKVTMIQMTPSRMQMLLHEDIFKAAMVNIRQMMLGGEPLTLHLLHRIKNVYSGSTYNMYGPTETTIWSTLSDLTEASTIHIGSPIQNTQIYILNAHMQLVPIGMVGDMYIGGRGLALGYLNRPELTARQFIPNPFDKNELIYKTGDIATWTSSGDIKCLGRVDNQVKIRGVRIELGEIESYLIKHPEIKAVAVIAVEQEHKIKSLYAYYIAEQELHQSEIKKFLLGALPMSMIPDVFIQLDKLPMTPNGKVDRKLLPIPSVIDQLDSRLFVAPKNELEERISNLCIKVLQVSKISVLDDFFDLGANSLKIISLAGKLNHELKTTLSVNDIYQHPQVRLLAEVVSGEHDQYAMQIDTRQIVSKISLKPSITTPKRPLRRILLLGASGFLGAHILKDILLINPNCTVCCILRGLDNQDAYKRLKELFQFYFHNQYQHEFAKRVEVIQGDISLENFGLSYEDFRDLGPKIDYVVHTAAMVKHVGIYMEFERINILATQRVVQFCQEYKIPLGYTSTISVSGHGVKQNKEGLVFSEDDLYIGQEFESNHYIKSKLVAEDLVLKEMMAGTLCCSILRVGYLTGRYTDGVFQKNHHENAFYNALKMIIDKGSISSDFMDLMLEFTPVDLCSEAIVKTMFDTNQQNRVLNLFNWNKISVQQFVASVQDRFDINLSHMPVSEYIHSLSTDHADNYIINYIKQAVESTQIELKYDKTEHYLNNIGFYWKQVDKAYLEKIIDYCVKIKLF